MLICPEYEQLSVIWVVFVVAIVSLSPASHNNGSSDYYILIACEVDSIVVVSRSKPGLLPVQYPVLYLLHSTGGTAVRERTARGLQ
jgi:hypothetical protein